MDTTSLRLKFQSNILKPNEFEQTSLGICIIYELVDVFAVSAKLKVFITSVINHTGVGNLIVNLNLTESLNTL